MDEMNYNGFTPEVNPEGENRAKTVMTLGIVALVCSFCCTYAGIIVGIGLSVLFIIINIIMMVSGTNAVYNKLIGQQ